MIMLLYLALISQSGLSINLVPMYQSGSFSVIIQYLIYYIQRPSGTVMETIVFAQPFASTPQVLLIWFYMDQDRGVHQYYFSPYLVTLDQLQILIGSTKQLYLVKFNWIAFLDDNIFTQRGEITETIDQETKRIAIPIYNPLTYLPKYAFFLNGNSFTQTPSQPYTAYNFSIDTISESQIVLKVTVPIGFTISWFSYAIVYGSPKYLNTGEKSYTSLGTKQLFTTDARTKLSFVSAISIEHTNNLRIILRNHNGPVETLTYASTIITYFTLSYFQYMPCPIYCTTCYVIEPLCDGCIPSTQRSGTTCTTCPSQMFAQSDQINCQQCTSYCNNCFGSSDSCVACQSATLRQGAPYCTSCPVGMFIELQVDECQPCKPYCDGCSGSPKTCNLCQLGTLRSNPPDCLTCPQQYHLVANDPICQPCLNYCDNCVPYSSLCVACSLSSLRLNPPNCLDCPEHMYLDGYTCHQCNSKCDSCDQTGCITCIDSSSYKNIANQCVNCPSHCLTCDINQCYSCAGDCLLCDISSCQKCKSDNYYIFGTDCIQCPLNCSTCNQSTCLTCIGQRIVKDNICQCQPNYRIIEGQCQYCPNRCDTCDEQGNCLTGPLNCKISISISQQVICTQCNSNYYLNNNMCIQCSSICLECVNQPSNCSVCRFAQSSQQKCELCEAQNGYYSNYQSNTCSTICGDGIVAGNEQCDDGNSINYDGCSNCIIDNNYSCFGFLCFKIIYPLPTLTQDLTLDSPYNSTKLFLLTYNVPIQATNYDINLLLIPSVNFSYNMISIDNQHFSLYVNLHEQSIKSTIQLDFKDYHSILSLDGISQQLQFLNSDISDYLKISNAEQVISDSANQITSVILIIMLIFLTLAVLFGGLGVLWNLFDLLQQISYLKYVNTVKPYYLQQFFNLFGFLQFQNLPLNQLLNTQSLISDMIETNYFNPPPLLIQRDGYTTSTILNIIPVFNVLFTGVIIYYISQLIERIVRNFNISRLASFINNFKFSIILYNLNFNIMTACDRISKQWKWSGLIRIFMSSANEIYFTICLGIYGIQIQKSNLVISMDFILTQSTIVSCITITYIISNIAGFQRITLRRLEDKYGSVFESLRFNAFTKYYNTILIYKKILFMIFLVLLYNEPVFQIICIILGQTTQLLGILNLSPIEDQLERYKQLICEILMLVAEISLGILVIDDYVSLFQYESRNFYGWICLFSILFILITQLCMDGFQQYKLMYKKYDFVRKIARRLSFKQNHYDTQGNPMPR